MNAPIPVGPNALPASAPVTVAPAAGFNYAELAPELASKLQGQAERIRARLTKTTADIIDIGRDLIATKESLQHGQFLIWVKTEIGISASTAQRWMRVAELGKSVSLTHLNLDAAYQLTAKDATPDIVAAVTAKAVAGEIMPVAAVKELMFDARQRRLMAEAEDRRKKRLQRMSRRKRQEREQQQQEIEAERRREKEAVAAAARALLERFGRDGVRFILDKITGHWFELQIALRAALDGEASP